MEAKRLGIFPNLSKEKVCIALPEFVELCKDWRLIPVLPESVAEQYECEAYCESNPQSLQRLDFAVSLGGDGTLLQMARYLAPLGVPAFGINFGKLGFLAEIDLRGMYKAISRLSQGNYTIETRSMLLASVLRDGEVIAQAHALNDHVLAKGMFSKLAHMMLFINGKLSGKYAADGLIIATATGSTAYSLSAGGPLVMPELDVSVITPVCAHSLANRALIIPMTEKIELKPVPGSEEMLLSADGENVIEVPNDTMVHIEKSPYDMKLVRLTSRDYYQTWQQKLMRN
ncbi:NAD(+)/NADH kinase [uncultured Phascolarctobacterium sp.]|jgi:NAD+ kinase|uniref:NAD(+)/NADH kinase n=1 Tax=uncultured Phascolarctobacterium sp. TaxID=512296 RepID=UPI0025E03FC0|nr:NAD(+)/NADH kinase [uncultured Phascolarctobacterium sp.]